MQVLYERCAAIDVGKDVIAVAVRLPGDGPDSRATVKRTFKTFYGVLAGAARWLTSLGGHPRGDGGDRDLQHAGVSRGPGTAASRRCWCATPGTSRTSRVARRILPTPSGWCTCWSAGCWPAASSRPRTSRPPGTSSGTGCYADVGIGSVMPRPGLCRAAGRGAGRGWWLL
jgi:hypothetical protein